jgi:hypothetical protein
MKEVGLRHFVWERWHQRDPSIVWLPPSRGAQLPALPGVARGYPLPNVWALPPRRVVQPPTSTTSAAAYGKLHMLMSLHSPKQGDVS